MIAGLIVILLGIVFAVAGVGGTAVLKIEGIAGGIVITISSVGGIVMIIVGALMLSVPA
jgi:hypothetical protein